MAIDNKQLVLKLALDGAGESLDIRSLDDRMRLQKAIYLLQAAGANLGYGYNWYLKGPYSTALTRDYFALCEALEKGSVDDSRRLKDDFLDKVKAAARVLAMPASVRAELSRPAWLELLASIHYLIAANGLNEQQMRVKMRETKRHLVAHIDRGLAHLRKHQLVL